MPSIKEIMSMNKKDIDRKLYLQEIQYQMPKEFAAGLIAAEKASKNKKISDPQKFLCDYVNREFGLNGYCTQVVLN